MILIDAIASVDNLVPNTFDETEKRRWLRDFDHLIYNTLISQYKDAPKVDFSTYSNDTVLLIEEPYSDAYITYLEAQIYRYLGELNRYNNAMLSTNEMLDNYKKHFVRTHEDFNHKFRCFTTREKELVLPPELRS